MGEECKGFVKKRKVLQKTKNDASITRQKIHFPCAEKGDLL